MSQIITLMRSQCAQHSRPDLFYIDGQRVSRTAWNRINNAAHRKDCFHTERSSADRWKHYHTAHIEEATA